MAKRTSRKGGKPIRQNRPDFKKKVIKQHSGGIKYVHKGKKIKSKEWENTKQ